MNKKSILIICEGYEEKDYFDRLISLNVFNENYIFYTKNAKGCKSIPGKYLYEYYEGIYNLILIFCDTDKMESSYKSIVDCLNKSIFAKEVADKIVIFANPCTLQIVLSHFNKVNLRSQSKTVNAAIVEQLTGVSNYKGSDPQRLEITNQIFRRTYNIMKENLLDISTNFNDVPSTNFLQFLNNFENPDTSWIDNINSLLC